MKILIMKFRHIGDVLLTSPLLSNLKRIYPEAELHFAFNEESQAMLTLNPNITKLHPYKRKKRGFFAKIAYELSYAWALRKEKFDIIIQTTEGDRGIYLGVFAKAKTLLSFPTRHFYLNYFITKQILNDNEKLHTTERNLLALNALGYEAQDIKVEVFSDKKVPMALPEKFIHIHPVSRWMFKSINDKTMGQIIDFIENDLKIKVVLTADDSEVEKQKIQDILKFCSSQPLNLAGKLSLKELITLSKASTMYIGVDTAVMHIAAANDIPVLAFFGPSSAIFWGPWDNSFLQNGYKNKCGIESMGKHTVYRDVRNCMPCHKAGCDDSGISDCLMNLDFSNIKNIIKTKLNFI